MGKQMLQVDSVSQALQRDGLREDVTLVKMRWRQAWGGGNVCWVAAVLAALLGFNGDELKEKRICFFILGPNYLEISKSNKEKMTLLFLLFPPIPQQQVPIGRRREKKQERC